MGKRAVDETEETPAPDWEEVFRTHRGLVRGIAVRIVRDPSAADEVVQETFAAVIKNGVPPDLDNQKSFFATVTARRAIDYVRRENRSRRVVPIARTGARRPGTETPEPVSDADVEADVEDALLLADAICSFGVLSDKEQVVMIERVMKNRRAKDVAADLGVSPQYVSQVVASALRKLRASLEPKWRLRAGANSGKESDGRE